MARHVDLDAGNWMAPRAKLDKYMNASVVKARQAEFRCGGGASQRRAVLTQDGDPPPLPRRQRPVMQDDDTSSAGLPALHLI